MVRRLAPWPRAAQRVRHLGSLVRGREIVLLAPLIFIVVFVGLSLFDWQCSAPPDPTRPAPVRAKRIQIIDGQHESK